MVHMTIKHMGTLGNLNGNRLDATYRVRANPLRLAPSA